MEKNIITRDRAIQALRDLVKQKGEQFIYTRTETGECAYQVDKVPSCAVGVALYNLGVDPYILTRIEGKNADMLTQFFEEHEVFKIELDQDAAILFSVFQAGQDEGNQYGWCLLRAEIEYIRLVERVQNVA